MLLRKLLNTYFLHSSNRLVYVLIRLWLNFVHSYKCVFAGTHTTDALQYVAQTVFGTEEFGDRPDVDNLVVLITDGVSTDGNETVNVFTAATDLHTLTDTVSK